MDKQELKLILKDMKDCCKTKEMDTDSLLHIATTDNRYYAIDVSCENDGFPKLSINEIEVAIFQGSDAHGIYLKNGLQSAYKAHKANII